MSLPDANLRAANERQTLVRQFVDEPRHSCAIETVLSTEKYRDVLKDAKNNGIKVLFVYILLRDVDQAVARVAHRVANGGHDVPTDKIRKRWDASLQNLPWFWNVADRSLVFYNGLDSEDPGLASPLFIAQRVPIRTPGK